MESGTENLRRYVADRSEAAFAALVQQHLSLVYHAALRRTNGDTHLAEEVAQAVFANLAREAGSLQHHAVLTGWLYVATRHAAANAMRSEQRRKAREREALVMNEENSPDQSGGEWERLRPELDSVMDELNETDRNAVLLRFFENRTYADIGTSFRISEDAARMRVDRALEKLRTQLARRGITSTAAALGGLLAAQSAVATPAGLANAVTGSVLVGVGAAATSTGTAGFIAFMTTNKIVMVAAGVATTLLVVTTLQLYQDNGRLAGELAAADRGIKTLRTQFASQSSLLKLAEENLRQAQSKAGEGVPSPGSTASGGVRENSASKVKSIQATTGSVVVVATPFANPDYERLQLQMTEANMKLLYGPMYRTLGWAPEKIREFERIRLQQHQNTFDIMAVANAKGVPLNSPGLNQQWNDSDMQELTESLRRLMGDKDYAVYQEYSEPRHSVARFSVDGLAGNLYYTDAPLSRSQAEQLTDLIVKHSTKPTQSSANNQSLRPNWDAIYAQAQAFLTPEQIETFRTLNLRNEVGEQLTKILSEAGTLRPAGS